MSLREDCDVIEARIGGLRSLRGTLRKAPTRAPQTSVFGGRKTPRTPTPAKGLSGWLVGGFLADGVLSKESRHGEKYEENNGLQ